jgi:hypothetical protein
LTGAACCGAVDDILGAWMTRRWASPRNGRRHDRPAERRDRLPVTVDRAVSCAHMGQQAHVSSVRASHIELARAAPIAAE